MSLKLKSSFCWLVLGPLLLVQAGCRTFSAVPGTAPPFGSGINSCSHDQSVDLGDGSAVAVSYSWNASSRALTVEAVHLRGPQADSYAIKLLGGPSQSIPLEDGKKHTVVFNQVDPSDQLRLTYRKKYQNNVFGSGDRPASPLTLCSR